MKKEIAVLLEDQTGDENFKLVLCEDGNVEIHLLKAEAQSTVNLNELLKSAAWLKKFNLED